MPEVKTKMLVFFRITK